jgi:hypothetical protein
MNSKRTHPFLRKEKGAVVALNGHCAFIPAGSRYTDVRGRTYEVGLDGSMRRVKEKVA